MTGSRVVEHVDFLCGCLDGMTALVGRGSVTIQYRLGLTVGVLILFLLSECVILQAPTSVCN